MSTEQRIDDLEQRLDTLQYDTDVLYRIIDKIADHIIDNKRSTTRRGATAVTTSTTRRTPQRHTRGT